MKYRKKNHDEQNSYWQTMTDILIAILLIVLLVLMLLMLYMMRVPEKKYINLYDGDRSQWNDDGGSWNGAADPDDGEDEEGDDDGEDRQGEYEQPIVAGGGGGGDDEGDYEEIEEPEEFLEYPGEGNDKTAVRVMVIDEETENTIKEAGLSFELYTERGGLEVLSTYYPVKNEFKRYETTKDGTFYLPEKISLGDYYLHELNAPKGYDPVDKVAFSVTESLDWSGALVVYVPLTPSRNKICLQVSDKDTSESIARSVYDVIAKTDIVTMDGTVRFKADQVVGQITCNQEGYGESEELFLGDYVLKQHGVPRYYASDEKEHEVSLDKKKGGLTPPVNEVTCEKTRVTFVVLDELYHTMPVEGAVFEYTQDGSGEGPTTLRTDQYGQIQLTNLEKNKTYHLRQKKSTEGYQIDPAEYTFSVSADGRVDGNVKTDYEILNRTLRISVGVKDKILRNQVSDKNLALFDSKNKLVKTWDSTGMAEEIDGLTEGTYFLVVAGDMDHPIEIQVEDQAEIQTCYCTVWTTASLATVIGTGIFVLFLVAVAVVLSVKKFRK